MEPLKTGLAGLQQVSAQLRNLPPNHKWDFGRIGGPRERDCGSAGCAIGLMRTLWPEQCSLSTSLFGWKCTDRIFELSGTEVLFGMAASDDGDPSRYFGKEYNDVTPHDVANTIDAYITKHQPQLPTLAVIITMPQKSARAAL